MKKNEIKTKTNQTKSNCQKQNRRQKHLKNNIKKNKPLLFPQTKNN